MRLSDITTANTVVFTKNSGNLVAIQQGDQIPWNLKRVFFITTSSNENRGNHAHVNGYQAFFCITGSVQLLLKDGISIEERLLNPLGEVVLVPPGIWVDVHLLENSTLAVFTDLTYDEKDYINNWDHFYKFKGHP